MATVRPNTLPSAGSVASGDAFIVDNGATVAKATPGQIVDAAIPLASQAEAEAGADNAKRMTPLRVKQAIDAQTTSLADLASTASGKGLALTGFKQSGTGAVDRTGLDKAREIISVTDFGADPTGGTDSTTAILAAIDALTPYSELVFPLGTYIVSSQLTISTSNVTLRGKAIIRSAATSDYEFILRASNLTGVVIDGLEFDLNQSARVGTQTVRFHGPYFSGCTECVFTNVTVRNTLGYGSVSAVGISIGQGTRCKVQNCRVLDCGISTKTSDAIYTSGTQNIISNCIASNCTDTGFVIEDSNYSVCSGCTALNCGSGSGVTLSLADDCYGNIIDGLTVKNWDAASTGGVAVSTLASSGNLYHTQITGLSMYADTGSGYGSGAALWVRRIGTGNVIGLNVTGFTIDGADYGVRVDDGQAISLNGGVVRNIASSGYLFLAGGTHILNGCLADTAATGIDVQGTGTSVFAKGCSTKATTSVAVQALNTSTLNLSDLDIISTTSGSRTAKDSGATLSWAAETRNIRANSAATATVGYTDGTIIQNTTASVYTLPSAASAVGMKITIITQFAGTVTSDSSNVVPLAGGGASTAILDATAGKWATLQSDGTYWWVIAAN